MPDSYETLLENYRNAWDGLRLIREAVETLRPPGLLSFQEAVVTLYGPEPIHEAQAIVDALTTVLGDPGKVVPFTSPGDATGSALMPHSITSSARARRVGGTSRPSDLAVLRLNAKNSLAGISTGSSPGLAPRRIRST